MGRMSAMSMMMMKRQTIVQQNQMMKMIDNRKDRRSVLASCLSWSTIDDRSDDTIDR